MSAHSDTIAALATPAGTAALAVLRISGPDTLRLCTELFGKTPLPRQVSRGNYRDRQGAVVDDVLFTFFAGPKSYTGEDTLEISCHGNPFIAQRILEDLHARGCRPANPGEFTQRAFLSGRMDLTQAEAVMDLIHARSNRALEAANRQLAGALAREMEAAIEELLGVLARVEAYIDFPDEDLPPEDVDILRRGVENLRRRAGRLLATSHYGAILREGMKTVLIGAPNVGKSSLLNQLVGRDRALVSPEAGTTRDFIEEQIVVGSHSVRLIDTAGLNPTPTELERRGMEKTLERLGEADLVLLVVDGSQPAAPLPDSAAARLVPDKTLVVANKADLPHRFVAGGLLAGLETVWVSALQAAGIEELTQAIERRAQSFQVTGDEELVAVSARHAHALERARKALEEAVAKIESRGAVELLASDLREALEAFGEISGRVDNERMLDALFATFCIGK
ncbi:MAG: tRNA uridine-5-carboxymethylaminomethyl(34) synthesis GTPase MnmE [Opitutus sp.]|nr:tRNA uridine-5-carboxymethylaminomethyl(34) synthesis GTPase MnmE [Opitutus sp.]